MLNDAILLAMAAKAAGGGGSTVTPLSNDDIDVIWNDGYTITSTITNGSATGGNKILFDEVNVTISANSGYLLPEEVTVVNADYEYNAETGVVTLSNPTGNVTITAECEAEPAPPVVAVTATVTGLGSSSPSSVTFTKDAGFTVAGLGIEEVTMGGDTFIKIPTMYRKVNTVTDGQITSFTMANAQVDSDYKPYSVFVAEDGTTVLPYVLIGKYWNTSSSSVVSTTETTSTASLAIGNARTYARNRGTGYQQYDWQFQKLWQDLIIIIKETVNTNSGVAWTYDELGIYWSTMGCWVDGICHNSGVIAASYKPSKYVDSATTSTDGYVSIGYNLPTTSSQEIKKLGYDANNPFVNYPSATESNNSYNAYYCDGYWYNSGSHPVRSSVGYANADNGVFVCNASVDWSGTRSVRLCYRPLNA